jgi:hypothetical protein
MDKAAQAAAERKAKAAAWHREVSAMKARAAAVDWSKTDFSKLAASDIGVKFGAPMTEEEFAEYRRRQGGRPLHVIKKTVADGAAGGAGTESEKFSALNPQ